MATPDEINEFDIMRQRIKERAAQRGKTAQTGVNQNFASRGLLQSGAQIKAQERAAQGVATQAREEDRDVLVAEAQVNRAQREAAAGRQFQTSERLGSQQFAGEQARLGEQFQSSERLAGQVFTGQQNRLAETFTSGENILNRQQNATQFSQNLSEQQALRTQNASQFAEDLRINKQTQAINTITALRTAEFSDDQIKTILSSLGINGDLFFQNVTSGTQNPNNNANFTPQGFVNVGTSPVQISSGTNLEGIQGPYSGINIPDPRR